MITLSRALAKRLVSLVHKTLNLPRGLQGRQAVKFVVPENPSERGLIIESATATRAVRYRDPGYRGLPQSFEVPLEALQTLAKSAAKEGEFSLQGEAEVRLHFVEKSMPREEGFSAPDLVLEAPASPDTGYLLPLTARKALIAAFETADSREPGRYALNRVQLQGSQGAVVATDGRQLLIQTGLGWPFEEDLLLANYAKLFRSGDFPEEPIECCKTERHFVFRASGWEFFLPIETSQPYPRVEDVLPSPDEAIATLEISYGDAKYLGEVLPLLPFDVMDDERPVTIELNGKIGIRARSRKNPAGVEVILRNSQHRGVDLLCPMKRGFLQRALELGLRRFQFYESGCAPVVVRQGNTTYCWATYDKNAVAPVTSATEIRESPREAPPKQASRSKPTEPENHAATHSSRSEAPKAASQRRGQRALRPGSRTAARASLWRWNATAKAG